MRNLFFKRGKGQSTIVSHSLIVMFAVIFLLIIITTMNSIKEDYSNFVLNITAKEICSLVKSSSEKIYQPVSSSINSNKTEEMGYVTVNLPSKIGSKNYKISFANETIQIKTSDNQFTCKVGLNTTFSGTSSGGLTKIVWNYGNGTNEIQIKNA